MEKSAPSENHTGRSGSKALETRYIDANMLLTRPLLPPLPALVNAISLLSAPPKIDGRCDCLCTLDVNERLIVSRARALSALQPSTSQGKP